MGKKILIADDVATILTMVKFILEKEGYEVFTAINGIEAVEKAYTVMPDLAILDILMPKMNGYQACRLLKDDVLTSNIPIIILTAQDKPIDKFWAKHTGADEYLLKDLIKGFKAPELIKTVEKLLNIQKKSVINKTAEIKISQTDIFTRVNDLLDKKLLESTVLNEISYIGRTIYDEEKTIFSIFDMLRKIIRFEIGAILLGEEKNILLYHGYNQSEENKNMIIDNILDYFNKIAGIKIAKDELTVQMVEKKDKEETPFLAKKLNSFLISELSGRGNTIGVLLLGCVEDEAYTDKDRNLLDSIVNQTSIIMDNSRLYKKIADMSITDGLTKLYNKRYLLQILPKEIDRAVRYERILSLLMFDIDFFKKINDTYGHIQGDIVLKEISEIVRREIRKNDIAVRYGDEEFIVILPEVDINGATVVAEKIRKAVEEFCFSGQKEPLHLTISLGVGICKKDLVDSTGEKIIKAVDEALYQAKKSGRNRICIVKE
ncbi:diguanylate cyclase [Candidatus Desantisbacteria bacterium]|nr:diguanylate cyclase [Candidatus Desantisbacteria bacterium]